MDFAYLAKVTKLNVAALAWLASAPPPPEPTVEGAVSTDTTISWQSVPGAASYRIRWRRTDSNQWEKSDVAPFTAEQEEAMVKACLAVAPPGLIIDCSVEASANCSKA